MNSSNDIEYPKKILDYMEGFLVSKTLFAACELGVFDFLLVSEQSMSSADIAKGLKTSVDGMERLLMACVGLQLLHADIQNGDEKGRTNMKKRLVSVQVISSKPCTGCSGAVAKQCVSAYPESMVTIFDLPKVVQMAKEHFVSLDERRISFHEGDFFRDPIPASDLYILARILHDWTDEKCLELLIKVNKACKPAGTEAAWSSRLLIGRVKRRKEDGKEAAAEAAARGWTQAHHASGKVDVCLTCLRGEEWCLEVGEVGHVSPDYYLSPPQEEEVEPEPQPQKEDGWEALLRSMGVRYCCCICGEWGHFPANCPLPPVRDRGVQRGITSASWTQARRGGRGGRKDGKEAAAEAAARGWTQAHHASGKVDVCLTCLRGEEWCLEVGEVGHVSPDYYLSPPQEEEVEPEPQPQKEDGWEALLRSMGVRERPAVPTDTSRGSVPAGSTTTSNGWSRAAGAVSVSTAVTSRGRVPAGPTTTSRGSMPAGSASITAPSRGSMPAGFTTAARRGGAPANFVARGGGAPAAFITFTSITATTITPSTRRGAGAASASTSASRGCMLAGFTPTSRERESAGLTSASRRKRPAGHTATSFTTPTIMRRGAGATSTSSPTNRGRMPVGLTTSTTFTTITTAQGCQPHTAQGCQPRTAQGCQPRTAQGCHTWIAQGCHAWIAWGCLGLRIAWGCLGLRIAWGCLGLGCLLLRIAWGCLLLRTGYSIRGRSGAPAAASMARGSPPEFASRGSAATAVASRGSAAAAVASRGSAAAAVASRGSSASAVTSRGSAAAAVASRGSAAAAVAWGRQGSCFAWDRRGSCFACGRQGSCFAWGRQGSCFAWVRRGLCFAWGRRGSCFTWGRQGLCFAWGRYTVAGAP
ncbi:UNVERIFIED_CONTAM: hypothetical protein FKN15_063016 [Acipenser sinensis]